jgi:hypothetical protein
MDFAQEGNEDIFLEDLSGYDDDLDEEVEEDDEPDNPDEEDFER